MDCGSYRACSNIEPTQIPRDPVALSLLCDTAEAPVTELLYQYPDCVSSTDVDGIDLEAAYFFRGVHHECINAFAI